MSPLSDDRARELRATSRKAEEWRRRRDEAILAASIEGASLRDIAEAVGMSHVGVMKLLTRIDAEHIRPLAQGGTDDADNIILVAPDQNPRKR